MVVTFDNQPIRFTASFGLVSAVPFADSQVLDYVSSADRALYAAKNDGRNCVRTGTLTAATI